MLYMLMYIAVRWIIRDPLQDLLASSTPTRDSLDKDNVSCISLRKHSVDGPSTHPSSCDSV